jgi:hypothetical protein
MSSTQSIFSPQIEQGINHSVAPLWTSFNNTKKVIMAIINFQNPELISSILGPAKHDFRQETV